MPTPTLFSPLSLPRQTSPAFDSKPSYSTSTNITADATLQSTNPVIAHQSGASAVAAQYSSANNIVTVQYSSSNSTATASVLAGLRQQHGADVPLGAKGPPSEAGEDQQQSEQQRQATATSRRWVSV